MSIIQHFNGLNGAKVTRKEIKIMILQAHYQEQPSLAERLQAVLDSNPKDKDFKFKIQSPAIEIVPESFLHCLECENDTDDKITGLGKAVSPNEIYQMITNKMIDLIERANSKDWVKKWNTGTYGKGYLLPFNFVTKKMYRGINRFLLTGFEPLENPFFLTFKQVEELGGKVKKGSRGKEVVYFTRLYIYQDTAKKIDISSYDVVKFVAMLQAHGLPTDNPQKHALPILKYYKVFNGKDIEGINFDLDNFKHGYIDNEMPAADENRMPVAEAIIKHYPAPQPQMTVGGSEAYYQSGKDLVNMPHLADFTTVQDFYNVFFHELSHSTGHSTRLQRKLGNRFGSKEYAFEELIAEFGATFLSAEAGIIWHTNKNHAAYLKGWNSALTHLKEDNRFLMRAATQAQKVADFVLQHDAAGDPKYFEDIRKIVKAKKAVKKTTKAKAVKGKAKDISTVKREITPKQSIKVDKMNKNPKGYAVKPKSVSVATAIADVLNSGMHPGIKAMQANVLFAVLKNTEDITQEDIAINTNTFQEAILNGISEKYIYYFDSSNEITLYPAGVKLITAIRGRVESLKNQKTNLALFDGLAGAKKKPVKRAASKGLKGIIPISQCENEAEAITEAPLVLPQIEVSELQANKPEVEQPAAVRPGSIAERRRQRQNEVLENFVIADAELAKFLGDIEKKKKESVVVTLTGGQGSMKTRMAFRVMNALAQNNTVGHASIEEHPESTLYYNKVDDYLDEKAQAVIDNPEIKTFDDLHGLITRNDVIVIDSFQKLQELFKGFEVDKDLRKKYDGKLFIIIFQQTTGGQMRGGSKSQFDADIVLFTEKCNDYRDNYVWPDKNRYNSLPTDQLKFNIFSGTMMPCESDKAPDATPAAEPTDRPELQFTIL